MEAGKQEVLNAIRCINNELCVSGSDCLKYKIPLDSITPLLQPISGIYEPKKGVNKK